MVERQYSDRASPSTQRRRRGGLWWRRAPHTAKTMSVVCSRVPLPPYIKECIFIPLKIAKRKCYKNAVGGVVHAAIQIAFDSDLSVEQWRLRIQHTCSPVTSPAP